MKKLVALIAIGVIFLAVSAQASYIAYDVQKDVITDNIGTGTSGMLFSTNQALYVTALGYFDAHGNGFNFSHDVGIYDTTTHSLIASATVNSGDTIINYFRYVSLAKPLLLSANTSYFLVGFDQIGDAQNTPEWSSVTIAPQITSLGYFYSTTPSGLAYPTIPYGTPYFGPNAEFQTVPEPAAILLFGLGLLGLAVLRRKFKKSN